MSISKDAKTAKKNMFVLTNKKKSLESFFNNDMSTNLNSPHSYRQEEISRLSKNSFTTSSKLKKFIKFDPFPSITHRKTVPNLNIINLKLNNDNNAFDFLSWEEKIKLLWQLISEFYNKPEDRNHLFKLLELLRSFNLKSEIGIFKKILLTRMIKSSLGLENCLKYFHMIENIKKKALHHIHERQTDLIIKDFAPLFVIGIEFNDYEYLANIFNFLGEIFFSCGNMEMALYFFRKENSLNNCVLYQFTKIRALISISNVLKAERYYAEARLVLWKALEFAVYQENQLMEFEIYDLLGCVYFLEGKLIEAEFYHKKGMNSERDGCASITESARNHCIAFLRKRIFKTRNVTLDLMFQLEFSPNFTTYISNLYQNNSKIYNRLLQNENSKFEQPGNLFSVDKFYSNIEYHDKCFAIGNNPVQIQINNMLADVEFDENIRPSSPRVWEEKEKIFRKNGQKIKKDQELENKITRITLAKKNAQKPSFVFLIKAHQKKKPSIFTGFGHKKSMDDLFRSAQQAIDNQELPSEVADKRVRMLKKKDFEFKGDKLLINHLSPNRSIMEFTSFFNPNFQAINNFFDHLLLHFTYEKSFQNPKPSQEKKNN